MLFNDILIINTILHLDDNILMWIELLPSLIMVYFFILIQRCLWCMLFHVCCHRCCVTPVSEMSKMSAMCMMYSCMLYQ